MVVDFGAIQRRMIYLRRPLFPGHYRLTIL